MRIFARNGHDLQNFKTHNRSSVDADNITLLSCCLIFRLSFVGLHLHSKCDSKKFPTHYHILVELQSVFQLKLKLTMKEPIFIKLKGTVL